MNICIAGLNRRAGYATGCKWGVDAVSDGVDDVSDGVDGVSDGVYGVSDGVCRWCKWWGRCC